MMIKKATFVISNTDVNKCPQGNLPEYAFIGRSNVGKSSLINMLADNNKLAMTSAKPGKTLLINHFLINDEWYLVDLPGYGYANRSKKQVESIQGIIKAYIMQRTQLTNLFLLIDIRHDPQAVDVDFINWLGEHAVPFAIVFTKADKLSTQQAATRVKSYLDFLRPSWEELPPHFVTSATRRTGKLELLKYIDDINRSLSRTGKQ